MSFAYRNGVLCAEEVPLDDIARRFGTPCYVYSRAAIEGAKVTGEGWGVTVGTGWVVRSGARSGDYQIVREGQ